jgi:hypothetical protein
MANDDLSTSHIPQPIDDDRKEGHKEIACVRIKATQQQGEGHAVDAIDLLAGEDPAQAGMIRLLRPHLFRKGGGKRTFCSLSFYS